MQRIIRYFLSISTIITFFSCEKEIKTDLKSFKPKLVINSILDTNAFFEVHVSSVSSISDTNNILPNNAIVEIKENNISLGTIPCAKDGIYISDNLKPKSGKIYTVNVDVPGYEPVSSCDTIPFPSTISDGFFVFPAGNDIAGDPMLEFTIKFKDNELVENYYQIILYTRQVLSHSSRYSDTMWIFDRWKEYTTDDPIILAEDDLNYKPRSVYFSDKLFNGNSVNISAKIIQAYGIDNMIRFQPDFKIIAELRTISYAYYQYLKKWTRHYATQSVNLDIYDENDFINFLYMGEPVNMYTNVGNGYGIFAGFSKSSIVLRNESKK